MRMRTSVQATNEASDLLFCTTNEGGKKIHRTSAVCRKTYISIKHIVFAKEIRLGPQANPLKKPNRSAAQVVSLFCHRIFLLVSVSRSIAIESDLRNSVDFASMADIMRFHRIIEPDILYFILILDRCLSWRSLFLRCVLGVTMQRQCSNKCLFQKMIIDGKSLWLLVLFNVWQRIFFGKKEFFLTDCGSWNWIESFLYKPWKKNTLLIQNVCKFFFCTVLSEVNSCFLPKKKTNSLL